MAIIQKGGCVNRDMFVSEQDIHNVAHNHARETYIKHAIDITSMRMWVAKNKLEVFYYYDVVELFWRSCKEEAFPSELASK